MTVNCLIAETHNTSKLNRFFFSLCCRWNPILEPIIYTVDLIFRKYSISIHSHADDPSAEAYACNFVNVYFLYKTNWIKGATKINELPSDIKQDPFAKRC